MDRQIIQAKSIPELVEASDFHNIKQPRAIIKYKNMIIGLKEGNIIILRSDNDDYLLAIAEFIRDNKHRIEILQDPYKPFCLSFKLRDGNKTYYLGFGRLNFFEYNYIINLLRKFKVIKDELTPFTDLLINDYKESVKFFYEGVV
ncbi:TPA: hypothetical protein [Aquificae Conch Spring virus]|nr:TPA: hypothetical protein [Aquificae Conch Spring virus]